ncbi:MAG: four helix bundle protein [Salinivirgaceae bacterium]|jgi:four helix bundle protein
MKENVIQLKTFQFAVRIIKLYKYLVEEKKEFVLSKQILKAGTSIGANTEEAIGGYSKKDFTAKLGIAYKEARETNYWLRLLKETEYISESEFQSLITDCEEILKILFSIMRTSNEK